MNVRFLGYFNPFVVKENELYATAMQNGYLPTHADGTIYENSVGLTMNGNVVDLLSGATYDGHTTATVDAPIGSPAVFIRAGQHPELTSAVRAIH